MEKREEKGRLLAEYSLGGTSYRKLAKKYGYGVSTIKRYLMAAKKDDQKYDLLPGPEPAVVPVEAMPTDVKQLQEELRNSRIKISLLEAMIDISDEQFGTSIRKKAGTRPS